jgi:hypothetical protein
MDSELQKKLAGQMEEFARFTRLVSLANSLLEARVEIYLREGDEQTRKHLEAVTMSLIQRMLQNLAELLRASRAST